MVKMSVGWSMFYSLLLNYDDGFRISEGQVCDDIVGSHCDESQSFIFCITMFKYFSLCFSLSLMANLWTFSSLLNILK